MYIGNLILNIDPEFGEVALLRLVSPWAVTDGETLYLPQKSDDLFLLSLVIALKSDELFSHSCCCKPPKYLDFY